MIVESVEQFVRDPESGSFESLALAVFRHQYDSVAPFRRLCDGEGVSPAEAATWTDVPLVPTLAFKSEALHAEEPLEVFRSSGTRDAERPSVHHHPHPGLYRTIVDGSFPSACLTGLGRPPMLSLIPSREQRPDSSLAFMVDHVLERFAGDGSAVAFGPRGVDVPAARSWLSGRQRAGSPVVVLATSLALAQLLDALERRYLHFRLPSGSVLFETGGFKGSEREVDPAAQAARVEEYLGIELGQIVREYGMTELTSQAYARNGSTIYEPPAWMRARVLRPEDLTEAPAGESGLLAFYDLGNVGSVSHVLTEDLGLAVEGGFRLLGRASDAELRGCSLTAEALAHASS